MPPLRRDRTGHYTGHYYVPVPERPGPEEEQCPGCPADVPLKVKNNHKHSDAWP